MTDHELTRRDALVALTAAGVAAGGLGALAWDDDALGSEERETLVAVARTLYPAEIEGVKQFVEAYVAGLTENRPERAAGIADAIEALDAYATEHESERYVDLSEKRRDSLLREMGVDTADPDPEGIEPARLRYYLVNELLFALYASPTGGRLVGIENPQGHPGGIESYRRGPDA
ncbi:MAG: gluconate 2-dehydrogenase subunit 3 family protein [Haloarculaceae archaeon]